MEKKNADAYLHLYLGCEMLCINSDEDEDADEEQYCKEGDIGILSLVNEGGISIWMSGDTESWNLGIEFKDGKHVADWFSTKNFKPILRPLSDMTDEEALKAADLIGNASHLSPEGRASQAKELLATNKFFTMQTNITGNRWIRLFPYLLKQGFDLFELIEYGAAIDKTTLNK